MVDSLKSALLQGLLDVALLPYQAWLAVSAILLTLTRLLITRSNLLEWVTSADSEARTITSVGKYYRWMQAAVWQTLVLLLLALFTARGEWLFLLPFALLWLASPAIACFISKKHEAPSLVDPADRLELEKTARKTWRFFEEFSGKETHFLTPDNYQAEPYRGIAPRTSPTNIGFGLLAVMTARDMGFIGTIEMLELLEKTITTVEGLPKWNGHLYQLVRHGYAQAAVSGVYLNRGQRELHRVLDDAGTGITGISRMPVVRSTIFRGAVRNGFLRGSCDCTCLATSRPRCTGYGGIVGGSARAGHWLNACSACFSAGSDG